MPAERTLDRVLMDHQRGASLLELPAPPALLQAADGRRPSHRELQPRPRGEVSATRVQPLSASKAPGAHL